MAISEIKPTHPTSNLKINTMSLMVKRKNLKPRGK
jgi:hypothetical protein